MKEVARYFLSAILLVILQVFVFNRLQLGYGIYVMVYPLFILLLPFRMKAAQLLMIAFTMGIVIDVFMNTYGLHASSLLLVAYFRPVIFGFISPCDDYVRGESTARYANKSKFFLILVFTILLHHIWFFILESFNLNEFLFTLIRIGLSFLVSLFFSYTLYLLFSLNKHTIR